MATVFMCFNNSYNSYIVLFIYLYTCYGFIAQFLLYRYQNDYNAFESQLDLVIRILVELN